MIVQRTREQIALLRRAGALNAQAHQLAAAMVRPGVRTAEIDAAVDAFFRRQNVTTLSGPTSISVNDEVMNGVPGPRRLREGDLVTIDIACRKDGWWADSAVTLPVGRVSPDAERLLAVTRGVLELAIGRLSHASRWSEVAADMEQFVRDHGFTLAERLGGHGIGRELHEDPQVPNRTVELRPENNFDLRPGLVLAIEPTVVAGSGKIRRHDNGWTWLTADGSLSAHFEHTVALTETGPVVLTTAATTATDD